MALLKRKKHLQLNGQPAGVTRPLSIIKSCVGLCLYGPTVGYGAIKTVREPMTKKEREECDHTIPYVPSFSLKLKRVIYTILYLYDVRLTFWQL